MVVRCPMNRARTVVGGRTDEDRRLGESVAIPRTRTTTTRPGEGRTGPTAENCGGLTTIDTPLWIPTPPESEHQHLEAPPRAPRGLSGPGRRLWRSLVAEYVLTPSER